MKTQKFRKKPVVIEAVQVPQITSKHTITDDYLVECVELSDWCGGTSQIMEPPVGITYGIYIPTLEGEMRAAPGDWIIKGVKGEFYPCKPDIFEATYEVAEGT